MKQHKSLKNTLMNILFYGITVFLILYIGLSVISPDKVIDVFRFQISSVPTDSMIPTIEPNDLIVEVKVNPDKVEVGDIIIFENYLPADSNGDGISDTYALAQVVHRVIRIEEVDGVFHYITKGDNPNNSEDVIYESLADAENHIAGAIVKDDIIAKYAFRIPFVGAIPLYFSQHVDPVFLTLVIVNIIIVVLLIKVLRKKPEEQEEKHDLE